MQLVAAQAMYPAVAAGRNPGLPSVSHLKTRTESYYRSSPRNDVEQEKYLPLRTADQEAILEFR